MIPSAACTAAGSSIGGRMNGAPSRVDQARPVRPPQRNAVRVAAVEAEAPTTGMMPPRVSVRRRAINVSANGIKRARVARPVFGISTICLTPVLSSLRIFRRSLALLLLLVFQRLASWNGLGQDQSAWYPRRHLRTSRQSADLHGRDSRVYLRSDPVTGILVTGDYS